MRKVFLAGVFFIFTVPALAKSPGGTEASPPVYRFVGYTDTAYLVGAPTVPGPWDITLVSSECQTLYGADAKPSTVSEYLRSPDMAPPDADRAFVLRDQGIMTTIWGTTGLVADEPVSSGGTYPFACSAPF